MHDGFGKLLLIGTVTIAMAGLAVAADLSSPARQPPTACHSTLTGRTLVVKQASFGTVQGQPPLPLRAGEYVLTFDDGPSAMTRQLLETLHQACVPAAFMMIGRSAAAHPDLVQAVRDAGQTIGSHSMTHQGMSAMDQAAREREITGGVEAVEQAGWGRPRPPGAPRLFRMPGEPGVPLVPPADWLAFLRREHLVLAGYDISPQDWRNDAPEMSFRRLMTAFPDRGVIVMHDWASNTGKLLPMVLDELRRRHATVVGIQLAESVGKSKSGSAPD